MAGGPRISIPLTRLAGHFAATTGFAALPRIAIETAISGFGDAYAAMLAGRMEPVVRTMLAHASSDSAKGEIPCLLGNRVATAEAAALVDGTAMHALDYDDYAFSNHPSAVLVPAIAACAAAFGGDGHRMITAYCVGYEIWGDLMRREPDHLHAKGWHPTSVLGPVGAAAAAAHMLRLDEAKSTNAIALAASHSGGVMGNFGSMAKAYHAGKAAEAGVRCALLARDGFDARDDALESETGLLAALSPAGNRDRSSSPQFGEDWLIERLRLNFKKYPTVGASQRCIDSILQLVRDTPIDHAKVTEIRPHVSERHAKVMPFSDPKNPAEAKFSLHFACAAAIRFGKVGLAEVSQPALTDGALRRLMQRTNIVSGTEYDPDYPGAAPYDFVEIGLEDGTVLKTPPIRRASGHADNPLDADAAWNKFSECAAHTGLSHEAARTLFDDINAIENAKDAGFLKLND